MVSSYLVVPLRKMCGNCAATKIQTVESAKSRIRSRAARSNVKLPQLIHILYNLNICKQLRSIEAYFLLITLPDVLYTLMHDLKKQEKTWMVCTLIS